MKRAITISLIIILVLAGVSVYYLNRNLSKIIVREIAQATGAEVKIEKLRLNPFTGFTLQNCSLQFPGDSVSQSVKKIELRYSFSALLKKQLWIKAVKIQSAEIFLQKRADGSWNWYFPAPVPEEKIPRDTLAFSLPLKLLVRSFFINGFKAHIQTPEFEFLLEQDKLSVENLDFKSLSDFQAQVKVRDLKGNLNLKKGNLNLSLVLDSEAEISDSLSKIMIEGAILDHSLYTKNESFPPLKIQLEGNFNLPEQAAKIDNLLISMKERDLFQISTAGNAEVSDKSIDFKVKSKIDELKIGEKGWVYGLLKKYADRIPVFSLHQIKPASINVEGNYSIERQELVFNSSLDLNWELNGLSFQDTVFVNKVDIDLQSDFELYNDSLNIGSFNLKLSDFSSPEYNFSFAEALLKLGASLKLAEDKFDLSGFNLNIITKSPSMELPGGKEIKINHIKTDIILDRDKVIKGELLAEDAYGGSITLLLSTKGFSAEAISAISPDFLDAVDCTIENLQLRNWGIPDLSGSLNGKIKLKNLDGHYNLSGDFSTSQDFAFISPAKEFNLSELPLNIEGAFNFPRRNFEEVEMESLKLTLPDWMDMKISGAWDPQKGLNIDLNNLNLDFSSLAKMDFAADYFPFDLKAKIANRGKFSLSGANMDQISGELETEIELFPFVFDSLRVSSVSGKFKSKIEREIVDLKGEIGLTGLEIPALNRDLTQNVNLDFDVFGNLNSKANAFSARVLAPDKNISLSLSGNANLNSTPPLVNLTLKSEFKNEANWIELTPELKVKGVFNSELEASLDSVLKLEGQLALESFYLVTPAGEVVGVGGRLPVEQSLTISPFNLKQYFKYNPFYLDARPYLSDVSSPVENIKAERLKLFGRELSDLSADVYWQEGYFHIPHFQLSLFQGNMTGSGWMRVDSGKIAYEIEAQAAEINSDLISQIKSGGGEASKISFNFNFSGNSLNPQDPNFDITGSLHITKISPKVAENLLLTLDPQQQDKGIQSTLYFLRKGWGIRSFSFEVAHGFVYSTIITQRPPPRKPLPFMVSQILPLEKEIRLSRLPLKFFLK